MAKAKWKAFPYPEKSYAYPGEALRKHWDRLHRGDCEAFPKDPRVQEAWRAYHRGDFAEAVALGLESGGAGITVANKARSIYANGMEFGCGEITPDLYTGPPAPEPLAAQGL